jgi:adenylate cyclase
VVEKPKRPSEQNQVAPKASSSSAKAEAAPLDRLDEGVHVSMSPEAIQDQDFVNAQARLKALTRLIDLPKKGIQVDELERNLVQLILDALPNATGVAIVQLTPDCTAQNPECRVRRAWKRREGNVPRYSVSNRLAYNVIRRRPECRLQLWFRGTDSDSNNQNNGGNFTVIGNGIDWTICCPLMSEYTQDLGIYVDGELPRNINKNALDTFEREELHDYQKFVEQAARILTNVRMVRALEKQTKQLSQFVPPMVLMAMKRMDIQTLFAPKAVPVSVLFCDLRSSCKVAEDAVTPEVLNALGTRIREALGVMTQAISTNDGVVGDLQGDAAMGFWGWPIDQPDQIDRAARAALEIRNRFFNRGALHRGDNSDLKCGIGMAHGLALAGAMGTSEHIKSDVFGPVVNLAARLEGMTKALGAPILVDETIGNYLRNYKPNQIAAPRARLMGRFLPAGMTKPVIVYELLPPEGARGDQMPENSRRLWEVAVEDFMSGNWSESRQKLDDFILQHSGSVDHSGTTMLSTRPEELKAAYLMLDFMQKNNYTVPISLQYWRANGAIDLPK